MNSRAFVPIYLFWVLFSILVSSVATAQPLVPPESLRVTIGEAGGPGGRVFTEPGGDKRFAVMMAVRDFEGEYTIPYIQSSRRLDVAVVSPEVRGKLELTLSFNGRQVDQKRLDSVGGNASFEVASPGEYELAVNGVDAADRPKWTVTYGPIGIGAVIAAIGDSITEGYFSPGFKIEDLNLRASRFPQECVSRDGRNFPQFAPTTHTHKPDINCFESWMTRLNDSLSGKWSCPVFVANEGWGGITTAGYLDMMKTSTSWQNRMRFLKPDIWLIHLGVNDERGHVLPDDIGKNLEEMVSLLVEQYGARPERILIAKPCYDYFDGAEAILKSYCVEIDQLVAQRKLSKGPDFFAAYSTDKEKWYGADPVHPNLEGMDRMADLWADAIFKALPKGPNP